MSSKYNININSNRIFQVKVRFETKKNKIGDKEIKIASNNAKSAACEAERIIRKQQNIKTARWLFAIDTTDGSIHY